MDDSWVAYWLDAKEEAKIAAREPDWCRVRSHIEQALGLLDEAGQSGHAVACNLQLALDVSPRAAVPRLTWGDRFRAGMSC